MDHSAKKGSCCENNASGINLGSISENNTCDYATDNDKVRDLILDNQQSFGGLEMVLNRGPIQTSIRLSSWSLRRGSAGAVQQTELNPGKIRCTPHQPIERVYFPNEMTFAQTANRGIAGHLAQTIKTMSDENCLYAQTMRCQNSFCASVAATDDHDIKRPLFHVKQSLYLPRQKL